MSKLREIFDRCFDCYADTNNESVDMAMTFEAFQQAIADYEKSKWVSVDEGKPEAFQEVLVILENGMISKGVTDFSGSWFIYFSDGRKEMDERNKVTHIQPLPTTPKP